MRSLESVMKGDAEGLASFDFDGLYEIVWLLAKTADNDIPEHVEWLEEFDEFPLFDIFMQLQDLVMKSLQSSKKK